jgi:hypothetical protein
MRFFPNYVPLNLTWLTEQSFRNKGHLLLKMLNSIYLIIGGKANQSVVRTTYVILCRIREIHRVQGLKGTVKYLKTCSVISQQFLGGHYHSNLSDLDTRVSRTRSGIPRIIPILWRVRFGKDILLTRYILSIFAIYRLFLYESPVKVSAITDPFNGDLKFLESLNQYIPDFISGLSSLIQVDLPKRAEKRRLELASKDAYSIELAPILTKSPTTFRTLEGIELWSSHIISVCRAYHVLDSRNDTTSDAIFKIGLFFNFPMDRIAQLYLKNLDRIEPDFNVLSSLPLGKLGLKQESAGKMRVFAMVDPITQWVLKPIHDFIFHDILDKIPMDGTFNQTKPLEFSKNWKSLYSLDLSSATDRLPVSLQAEILNKLYDGIGKYWIAALTGREFCLPGSTKAFKYAVGQPMGAYSSWAMLALTHHFIVQVAAWISCTVPRGTMYKNYAVLGDDIVIGDSSVANTYLDIISKIGVKCGLHKSLLSPRGSALEFAKRTWVNNNDVSPVSIREVVSSMSSIQSLVALGHKYNMPLPKLLKVAGFGYKVLGGLNKPFYKLNMVVRNTILSLILPAATTDVEMFGHSSLTKFVWEPEMVPPLQELMISLFRDLEVRLSTALYRGYNNPLLPDETSRISVMVGFIDDLKDVYVAVASYRNKISHPVLGITYTPIESLKYYRSCLLRAARYFEIISLSKATAKLGVDPFMVQVWKLWTKVINKVSKELDHLNQNKDENPIKESNMLLPILNGLSLISRPGLSFIKSWTFLTKWSYWIRHLGLGGVPFLLSLGRFVFYLLEWFWLLLSGLLVVGSFLVIYNPEIFPLVIFPILVSIFSNYWAHFMMSAVGIEVVNNISWWSYILSCDWISYPSVSWITTPCSVLLSSLDWGVNQIIWYNSLIFKGIYASIGFVGLWASLKVFSAIKFIIAATTHTTATAGLTGPIMWLATFLTQTLVLVFVDPLMAMQNNFTISSLMLFILPDPLGLWNYLIAFNVIPWSILYNLVHLSLNPGFETGFGLMILTWNIIVNELPSVFNILLVTSSPHDIITYIFGPMDQRLGSIVSGIRDLRTIWR